MKLITIYVTYKNLTEAQKITNALLKNRLIACATFLPIKSHYWWKNKVQKSNEIATFLTAKGSDWNDIKKMVKKMHSYQVPCIKKEFFLTTKDYEAWIKDVTTK
ncbi:MAG: divalent-cation tolerance protein CutA [Candidatus Buchananbacteria bacterium]|nr:divalent-cation tolerance protein CutA [Candidatus Buchananbacteria bacterium]